MNRMLIALACVCMSSCINEDLRLYETQLRASLVYALPASEASTLHVEVHHAQKLSSHPHPLGLIEAFTLEPEQGELAPASFERSVLVPVEEGEGLVVYAWLDLDGDGELCGLDGDGADEPAGLLELGEFPAHELDFELALDASCVGPEGLYP